MRCLIINRPDGLEQRFIFSAYAADWIERAWKEAGSSEDCYTANSFIIWTDSLGLTWSDRSGRRDLDGDIPGDVTLSTDGGYHLFALPDGYVFQDTLAAPLWRQIRRTGSEVILFEGFRNADVAGWPKTGYEHCDSRVWTSSTCDTYISASAPGTSYYSSASIVAYRDATLGIRQRTLVWFRNLADSLSKLDGIDSALMQLHYAGGLIGIGTARLCRGIADSTWYNSARATWNARYKLGNDSLSWAGGWGVHSSSFTSANSVSLNLADTSSTGWYRFSCRDMMLDIKAEGNDWGFWIDNGSGSNSQRISFDSADDPNRDYPKLYIEYSHSGGTAGIRRRRMEG